MMWPFKKKNDSPEAVDKESEEEKLKQKILSQLVFDPVTKKLMIKAQMPETPKEVKPECPTCKKVLEKYSRTRFKCPHCRNWVCFWEDRLVTQEEKNRSREERQKKYYEKYFREQLMKLGLTFEEFKERETKLTSSSEEPPKEEEVVMSLFNENILKTKDLRLMEQQYHEVARYLDVKGNDTFHIQKAAAHARLAALKQEKFKKVYILSHGNCDACKALDGEVMTIEKAKKTLPIPIREGCTNRGEGDKYSICVCSYEGEADDEYIDRTL
jgi:hypothetical protein